MSKRVLVAMSGGVDSSAAAALLHAQGYECLGVTMRLYENETVGRRRAATCCSLDDIEDARAAAFQIGIPYHVFSFSGDFERCVIRPFAESYEAGCTPNPCIACNRWLKFDRLYHRARQLGCDFIATGHYAQIACDSSGQYHLHKARDTAKDQSYVLYMLTQEQLAHTLFPLGALQKEQVRALAQQYGLANARKRDSEDICFVPDGDYAAFLERYRGRPYPAGDFLDAQGRVLGRHRGFVRYTVGQRRGLGVSAPEPLYVTARDAAANTVTLGSARELLCSAFEAGELMWTAPAAPEKPFRAEVCVRYHAQPQSTAVIPQADGTVRILPDAPLRAVTPGQAAVFYRGSELLGGGTIRRVLRG